MTFLQDHRFIPKVSPFLQIPTAHLPSSLSTHIPIRNPTSPPKFPPSHSRIPHRSRLPTQKIQSSIEIPAIHVPHSSCLCVSIQRTAPFFDSLVTHLQFSLQNLPWTQCRFPTQKIQSLFKTSTTHVPDSTTIHVSIQKTESFFDLLGTHLQFPLQNLPWTLRSPLRASGCSALMAALSFPFPSSAAETEQFSGKINIEEILVSIDDFFNRNPFFVAGLTVIWLVVIPLTEEFLKKYKFISAIDAFRKLRDVPCAQLLDIRQMQSVNYMGAPNLKILNKNVIQLEFNEGEEESFVKEVLMNFEDPGNTIICILDNFDGNSLKVAELLFKNGFKEAYAIKGGLRGKDGWQAIQETLLPPSVHVYPRKKKRRASAQSEAKSKIIDEQGDDNGQALASPSIHQVKNLNLENGYVNSTKTSLDAEVTPTRPLSPYPKYHDFKPPSSPTPTKPQC